MLSFERTGRFPVVAACWAVQHTPGASPVWYSTHHFASLAPAVFRQTQTTLQSEKKGNDCNDHGGDGNTNQNNIHDCSTDDTDDGKNGQQASKEVG